MWGQPPSAVRRAKLDWFFAARNKIAELRSPDPEGGCRHTNLGKSKQELQSGGPR